MRNIFIIVFRVQIKCLKVPQKTLYKHALRGKCKGQVKHLCSLLKGKHNILSQSVTFGLALTLCKHWLWIINGNEASSVFLLDSQSK